MKMTFQPKKRSRSKVHGFRARMSTAGGKKKNGCQTTRKETVISLGRICGLFFYSDIKKAGGFR